MRTQVARAVVQGYFTLGYINALQIEKILPEDESSASTPYRSNILLKGGLTLPCLNTFTTLQLRCLQGKEVKEEYLRRQEKSTTPTNATIPGATAETKTITLPVDYQFIVKNFFESFITAIAERG